MNSSMDTPGYTLLEVLIVMALMAIASGIALPGILNLVESSHKRTTITNLISGFNLARTIAIQEGTSVTICPLDIHGLCSRDWSKPIILFRDPDRTRQLRQQNQILRTIGPPSTGRLTINTANRRYFGYRATGMARSAIGNIIWCPDNNMDTNAIQLRINMGGRLGHAQDRDGDGIVEGSDGQAITCTNDP
ncbi:GspH/FimT family pseudopilin [Marinobacter caseinilyticus]|uniref:GspH/FimT family pseudopilin n=1 Tax=Marinobacter caseinilyticus TaxID=2692195 RepID=UPI0014093CD3|nr:GspH/FimT family pseudopilin [Marinobacter caseinilyticus]